MLSHSSFRTLGFGLALLIAASSAFAGARDLRRQSLFSLLNGLSLDTGLEKPQIDPNAIPIFEYYPMDVGRQWTYRDEKTPNAPDYTVRVDAKLDFKGFPVARLRRMDKPDEYELTRYSGALQLLLGHDEYQGDYDWSGDPVPFSRGPTVKIGDRFDATPKSFVNPLTGGHVHWIINHKRLRSVTVPAGTFDQCLQVDVRTVDTKTGAELTKFSMYLAPGVGMVLRQGRFLTTYFKQVLISL